MISILLIIGFIALAWIIYYFLEDSKEGAQKEKKR
jgi:hypothetical protein